MSDEAFMREALRVALEGVGEGQAPFGACIVKEGRIVASAHNAVWRDTDITAHAEVRAIRSACEKLGTVDLSGCVIYSTCEPCPMCFSACHWARLTRIVYGARIGDAEDFGFHELPVSAERMSELGGGEMTIVGDLLRDEALQLFREWAARDDRRTY
jgi:tRNA(Arg) A34 adenosine deaminase TadA